LPSIAIRLPGYLNCCDSLFLGMINLSLADNPEY
jgi:hypothetical protein